MGSVRLSSLEDGVPTECQQLLSPSSKTDISFPTLPVTDRYTADQKDHTMSSEKLGASAFNFFLSGMALVAVGVCW